VDQRGIMVRHSGCHGMYFITAAVERGGNRKKIPSLISSLSPFSSRAFPFPSFTHYFPAREYWGKICQKGNLFRNEQATVLISGARGRDDIRYLRISQLCRSRTVTDVIN